MIIKDKEIIEEGTKIFKGVYRFKSACSDYFRLRNKGLNHEFIKEYLDLNEMQENFIKNLWETPRYRKSYEAAPWIIIYNGPIKQSVMRWWNGRYWESSEITEKPSCDTVENI